jgi:phage tail sheath gpL-like
MPGTTVNPKVNISLSPAAVIQAIADRRDLIFGQLGVSATATSEALNIDMHTKTNAELQTLFGVGEMYYRILQWIEGNDKNSPLDVIGITPTGSAGTCSIQVTGTAATADGSFTVSLIDEEQFTVTVDVTATDTIATIATAIKTALDAVVDPLWSTGVATATATMTALDVGTICNSWGIKVVGDVPGIGFTVTGWSGGTGVPTLTTILDNIAGIRYTGMSWPEAWVSNIDIPKDELDTRFNASDSIMDGIVVNGSSDTFANNKALALAENSQSLVFVGNDIVNAALDKGPAILMPADWAAAYFLGVRSKRLTPDANIASDVIATGLDSFGGISLASLPYFNTEVKTAPITSANKLYSPVEQGELEESGFTTFGVNKAGNSMIMASVVTTWTTDAGGNPNTSFAYLNFVDTASVCRETFFNVLSQTYAQFRLTTGDLVANRAIANEGHIRGTLQGIYKFLANKGLTVLGTEAESFFNDNTTITIDLALRKVTITSQLPIVTQIGRINYSLQLAFQTGTGLTIT